MPLGCSLNIFLPLTQQGHGKCLLCAHHRPGDRITDASRPTPGYNLEELRHVAMECARYGHGGVCRANRGTNGDTGRPDLDRCHERLTEDEPKIWVHVMSKTVRQERGLRRRHFLRGNRKHGACRRGHPN